LNSGSYTTQGVAPGSIVPIFGTNLAAATASASAIPLPTALSDVTSVTFNDIPAGLYFVSPTQINAQLPFNVLPGQGSGTVNIVVTRNSGTSIAQNVTVVPAAPGIFSTTSTGLGQAFAYDNTTGALAAPAGGPIGPFTTAPISVSSGHALIIACTGLGSVNPSIDDYVAASDGTIRHTVLTPTVLIGGVPAQLIYSVLSPQFVSEYQIAVTLAANTPTGNTVPIQIQIGSVTTSDQVTVAVARKSSDERGVFARECPHPPQARVNDQRIPEGNSIQPLNGGFLVGRFITAREVLPD
jgi:adhesin/invasin